MNQEPNQFAEQSRQASEATKRLKKRMVIVLVCMVVFAAIALPLISYLETLEKSPEQEPIETHKPNTFIPYEADWDLDIMKEPGYLAMDRSVYYCDSRYGITEVLDEKSKDKYGPAVSLLYSMIGYIIQGDHENYNELFSKNYFKTEGNEPEEPFTMQQLYDIKLTLIKETEKTEGGKRYTQYEYEVEYRMPPSDCNIRTDIDEGESKKQYFILSDSTSNDVLIDQILGYVYKN
jgi:hypothetical protein